jgi:hypothetical protein
VAAVLGLALLVGGCGRPATEAPGQPVQAAGFASYREVPVEVQPSLPPYQVADGLANVSNREDFEFSPQAQELLEKNAFVVMPGRYYEFFMLYESNRYDGVPSFVSSDALLHNYHLFFSHLLKSVEGEHLIPELKKLNAEMLATASRQYQRLRGSEWENAARRNLAFFAVGSRLLDPASAVPGVVRGPVEQELALIAAHDSTAVSPVMAMGAAPDILENLKEDYTQYIPRGHYTRSQEFARYFTAMMWYGRLTFRLKDEDETRSAVLMTLALAGTPAEKSWQHLYEVTSFFVGKSDDLGYPQYRQALREAYGRLPSLDALAGDRQGWKDFLQAAGRLEPPQLNSIPIFDENIQPEREREIKGFRFMGQRFTLDAAVFQRLVYREVGENSRGERRLLPAGLDIPAAMGSRQAYALLRQAGHTDYRNYARNMERLRAYIAGLDLSAWTQNLYWSWLYALRPLTVEPGEGYPSFMRSSAWLHKQLSTYLGSWIELKHDTILYAKQVYAEMGGPEDEERPAGYVEPIPHLYARLAALLAMTREGLQARGLLDQRDGESLERMEELALSLKRISEKELAGTALTAEEQDLIRTFGGQLEHFWLEALRDEGVVTVSQLSDHPAALVADVATAPPDTVLEGGTGYISEIYVVVPVDGQLRLTRGGVFAYYEFPWPASDRLTDEKWHAMLEQGTQPPPPSWTQVYTGAGTARAIPAWE